MPQPGLSELLIRSALDPNVLARLRDSPDEVLAGYAISAGDRELLLHPDHRLLALLGRVLREAQPPAAEPAYEDPPTELGPPAIIPHALAPMLLALTVVPCIGTDGGLRYAVWVNPMAEDTVPATLPPPPSATLPGAPLAPLYAVIELDGVGLADGEGNQQVTLFAQLRQATNAMPAQEPAPPDSEAVAAAALAVRAAAPEARYKRLAELVRAIEGQA